MMMLIAVDESYALNLIIDFFSIDSLAAYIGTQTSEYSLHSAADLLMAQPTWLSFP